MGVGEVMSHLYNFGLSQEDERSEARALDLRPTDRVLSIVSAGEMPLSLLSMGVARVLAVDVCSAPVTEIIGYRRNTFG